MACRALVAILFLALAQVIACQSSKPPSGPLLLTPLIQQGTASALEKARQQAQVNNLFGNGSSTLPSYSGFLTVNEKYNSNLFFWLFPAMTKQLNPPLILWLNGGPGYSSLYGLFNENGPYVVDKNQKVLSRNFTWNKQFSVLYIDQPVGAGFSFTDNDKGMSRSLEDSSKDLYEALKQFFALFTEYQNSDFWITGESYAGKYIPGIAHQIHKHKKQSNDAGINLKGIAIGNGLVEPCSQMVLYGEYLFNVGLIGKKAEKYFKEEEYQIKKLCSKEMYLKAYRIWDKLMLGELTNGTGSTFTNETGFTYRYNILEDTAPPDFKYYEKFVVLNSTRDAIHVGNRHFDGNSFVVETYLFSDFMISAAPYVEELLDADYQVLLFSGALDIIVPTVSSENLLQHLKWKGAKQYRNAPRKQYRIRGDNQITGYVQQQDNLMFVTVRNAGHVVPYERPDVAYDLIEKLVIGKPF